MKGTTRCLIPSVAPARRKRRRKRRNEEIMKTLKRRPSIMRKTLAVLIIATGLLLAAVPVWAHHAFSAEFDASKPVKFRATVVKMEWINPHAWIQLDVKGDDGKVTRWAVE